MSRPSSTTPPSFPSSRWRATISTRTPGWIDTSEDARLISRERTSAVTSSPSSSTRRPPSLSWMLEARSNAASASAASSDTPARLACRASARYMAPVSM
jgi:hypothetical protein